MFPTLASLLASAMLVTAAVDQVHLGLTNDNVDCPNGVSVAFASDVGSPLSVSFATPGASLKSVPTTVDSFKFKSKLYSYTSPFLHTARLCNLVASATYAYAIGGSDKACAGSFVQSFVMPPRFDADTPTVLGIIGDVGSDHIDDTLANTAAGINGTAAHAIFIVGDLAYANGEYEQWDAWYRQAQPIFSSIPTLVIGGNHETTKGGGATKPKDKKKFLPENYLGYIHHVNNPVSAAQNAKRRTYYSMDVGHVHAVFVDDYVGYRGDDDDVVGTQPWMDERNLQLQWLENDLASVDRKKTPWVLVLKHNPYYNSWDRHQCQCDKKRFEISDADKCWAGEYHEDSDKKASSQPHCANQAKLEDVYVKYGVDIVAAGHVHSYERTAPIVKNKIDTKKGVVYITTGAGGHGNDCTRLKDVPAWSAAAYSGAFGATRMVATRDALNVYWFANKNETALDAFVMTKDGIVSSTPSDLMTTIGLPPVVGVCDLDD